MRLAPPAQYARNSPDMRQHLKQPGHDGPSTPSWSQVLRALRKSAGITQVAWAARLGYGPRTVQRWERGEVAPDAAAAATLVRLCAELQLFRDYVTDRSGSGTFPRYIERPAV
jgi:DNA-binding transcriptional regulator YiaG